MWWRLVQSIKQCSPGLLERTKGRLAWSRAYRLSAPESPRRLPRLYCFSHPTRRLSSQVRLWPPMAARRLNSSDQRGKHFREESMKTEMGQTIESKNKALVLEAFDTLFNKRDYVAAERYWSSNYIQHSAHIE